MARAGTIITRSTKRWQEQGFFILLLALYALLFLPFWKPVVLGFLFAAACGPLETRLRARLHSQRTPVVYGILIGISLLVLVLLTLVAVQGYSTLFGAFDKSDSVGDWMSKITGIRDQALAFLQRHDILTSVDLHKTIDRMTNSVLNSSRDFLLSGTRDFLASTPEVLLTLFIFLLAFASFLLMGGKVFVWTARMLGIEGDHEEQYARLTRICALSLGSVILIGLLQATLITIGALISHLGNYFIVFAITFILAMFPMGGGVVAISLALFAFFQGEVGHGVILMITFAVSVIADNVLKAWLFSKAAATNPLISLISLLGGVALMGFPGLFVAPTIEQLVMAEFHRRQRARIEGFE